MLGTNIIFLTAVMTHWLERSIGAYQLSNFIKNHGYSTQVIDFIHLLPKDVLMMLLKKFTGDNTQVLAVSSTFISYEKHMGTNIVNKNAKGGVIFDNLKHCLIEYKKLYPHVKLIVGGAKAKQYEHMDLFDFCFTGYGELALLNFLKAGATRKGKMVDGDLYLAKFNAHEIDHKFSNNDIIFENETLPIEISRGCIFKCKFCAYPLNGKSKLEHVRDVNLIKEELINNYEKWGITNYLISDDTFNDSNDKLKILHDMIVELPFKINFVCYLRLDLLYHFRDTQLEMLERMGLKSCHFGVESFNPTTAKFIGKGMSEDKTKDFLLFLKERWNGKISFMCTFINGLPFESKESCIETGNWCIENDITFWMMPLFIDPNRTYKSDIDVNYEKYGYKLEDNLSWTTEYMTMDEAVQISARFTSDPSQHKISAWNMFALLTLGVSADELYHLTYSDLDKNLGRILIQKKMTEYVQRLMAL
jgi:radical SAM superfamily enzyme